MSGFVLVAGAGFGEVSNANGEVRPSAECYLRYFVSAKSQVLMLFSRSEEKAPVLSDSGFFYGCGGRI